MNTQSFRMFIFIIGMFIIIGCTTPTVDAGSDKIVQVNQSIQITGTVSNANGENVTFIWKEGSTVLANSASFSYTPTTIGKHTLTFYVSDDKGNADNDSMVVTVEDDSPKIETITIDKTSISLREGNETQLSVTAHYNDATTKDISSVVEWGIGDTTVISVVDATLKALKEGDTTLKASYANKISDEAIVTVYKEISGYKLPPEPDPDLNNATLLGIDSNDNGIRDDVERFIVIKYQDHHKIVTESGLQKAKAYQKILENPLNTTENHKALHDATECNFYFETVASYFGDPILIDQTIELRPIQLNIKSRVKAYLEYDKKLSGGVYEMTKADKMKEKCAFDVDGLLGGE